MKTLEERMLDYSDYHQDLRNKITHFIGVPIIVYSLFIPMGWFRFVHADIPLTGATIFFLAVLWNYVRLDWRVALLLTPISGALLYLADKTSLLPFKESLLYFLVSFIGGWAIQLVGHVFEGRKPALVDNILQIFNAPFFLMVEILFFLGYRPDLRVKVNRKERKEKTRRH